MTIVKVSEIRQIQVVTQLFLKSNTCLSAENMGYSASKFKFNLNNWLSSTFVEFSSDNETDTKQS